VDSREFAASMQHRVARFCATLGPRLPAYSYIPLTTDEQRIQVMQCRLFNEVRAAQIFARWAETTPEPDVRDFLTNSAAEELSHRRLLVDALEAKGADPFDYSPLPSQADALDELEALESTVERVAAFGLVTEGVATFLMRRTLADPSVPEWVRQPYQSILAEEEGHGEYPIRALERHAKSPEQQAAVERAVEASLVLRQRFFEGVDRWVLDGEG